MVAAHRPEPKRPRRTYEPAGASAGTFETSHDRTSVDARAQRTERRVPRTHALLHLRQNQLRAAYGSGIAVAIYFVLGILVAVANDYFDHLTTFGRLLSALLTVLLPGSTCRNELGAP